MTNARLNAKYSAFYVTRFSQTHGRYVSRKKPYPTIEAALTAARLADRRSPDGYMHFVDVVA